MHSEGKISLLESDPDSSLVTFLPSRWWMVVDRAAVSKTVTCPVRSSGLKSSLSQPLDREDIERF